MEVVKRFLGDRPALLYNLLSVSRANRNDDKAVHNVDGLEYEAVGIHDDDDVCVGLGVLQPVDDAHRLVVRKVRVLALLTSSGKCEQRRQREGRC